MSVARSEADPRPAVPHRSAILWLFAAVLLAQPLQYAIIARVGEPYPALRMPQFAGTMTDASGNVLTRAVEAEVVFDDASAESVSMNALLAQAPVSHRSAIARFVFSVRDSAPPATPAATAGVKQRIKRALFPGLLTKYELMARPTADPRTVQWLDQRLHTLYPSKHASRVSFLWYDDTYRLDGDTPQRSRRLIGKYDVDLRNAR